MSSACLAAWSLSSALGRVDPAPAGARYGALEQAPRARTSARAKALTGRMLDQSREIPMLLFHGRRVRLPGKLLARRVDVRPWPRAPGPDVRGDLHRRRVVERADAERHVLGR